MITPVLAFGIPSGWEWAVILIVAVLLFGSRLPKLIRDAGSSVREFRSAVKETEDNELKA